MSEQSVSDTQNPNFAQATRLLQIYERDGAHGLERHFDEFFHPDFDWRPAVSGFGEQIYRGRDGFSRWVADVEAISTVVEVRDMEIRPAGENHVLGLGRLRFVGKESGLSLDSDYGMLFRMEDGRAASGRAFLSHAEAEEAAAEIRSVDA